MAINFNPNDFGSNFGFTGGGAQDPSLTKLLSILNIPGLPKDFNPSSMTAAFTDFNNSPDGNASKVPEKLKEWDDQYTAILKRGDGNAAVAFIIKGLKDGTITKEQARELAKTVQEGANAGGGGKINGEMREALKKELGIEEDLISKGKTRAAIGWDKFIGGVKGIFTGLFGFGGGGGAPQ